MVMVKIISQKITNYYSALVLSESEARSSMFACELTSKYREFEIRDVTDAGKKIAEVIYKNSSLLHIGSYYIVLNSEGTTLRKL